MTAGFIKMMRINHKNSYQWEFLLLRPSALALFTIMAHRARRAAGIDPKSGSKLEAGECFLGDFKTCGLSARQYRTAKGHLEKVGLAAFKPTNRGTIGKIINSVIYNINIDEGDEQNASSATSKTSDERQETDNLQTTNKECEESKNVKKLLQQKFPDLSSEVLDYILAEIEVKNPDNAREYGDRIAQSIIANGGKLSKRQLAKKQHNKKRNGEIKNGTSCQSDRDVETGGSVFDRRRARKQGAARGE